MEPMTGQYQQSYQQSGFQPAAGGFGLQMPQIGFQGVNNAPPPMTQPALQPLGFGGFGEVGQPTEPTTFTIGIPGGFQFVSDPSQQQAYGTTSGAISPYSSPYAMSPANRELTGTLRTRDASLVQKKAKKTCLCC